MAEGKRWVVIAYSPKKSQVGKCVEMDADEAKLKVGEGRVRYATDEEIAGAGGGETAAAEPGGSTDGIVAAGGRKAGR